MSLAKKIRFGLVFFLVVIILIASGTAVFIYLFPKDKLLDIISTNTEIALKRKVTIGDINYGLGGVILDDVILYDGTTIKSSIIASTKKVNLRFSLLSLIQLHIDFDSITLINPAINIIFDKNGVSNLERLISDFPEKDDSSFTANISYIRLSNATINLKNPPKYLNPLTGSYNFTGDIQFNETIDIVNSTLILPHGRGTMYPDLSINKTGDLKIVGSVGLKKTSLLWVYKWHRRKNFKLPYYRLTGNVLKVTITKDKVIASAKSSSTLNNSKKIVYAEGNFTIDIKNKTVLLNKIKGNIEKSSFFINEIFFTWRGKLLSFNVNQIDSYIQDIRPVLTFMPVGLFGNVKGNLRYKAGLYNGNLYTKNMGYDPKEKILSKFNTVIRIKDNLFKNTNVPIKFYNNNSTVSFASNDRELNSIFVNFNSPKTFISTEKHKFNDASISFVLPVEVNGHINVAELEYGYFKFYNVKLNYNISKNKFNINKFLFNFAEGKVHGKGEINGNLLPPRVTTSLMFNNIKIQNIISINKNFKNRFFGLLDGKAKINLKFSDNLIKTATGNFEFSIDRGKLVDTGIQKGLGILLTELKYKLNNLEFNKIYGNIDISGTKYNVNTFIFNSTNIRLKVNGAFDQKLRAIPMYINLEFNTHFIEDLRGALTLGLRKYLRGDWYTIPFILNGDITNSKNLKRMD